MKVLDQLKPNGGQSLVDKIDTVINKLITIEQSVDRLEVWKTAWMELADNAIFIANKLGRIIWVNNEYLKVTGSTFSEVEGLGWYKVIHPEDRAKIKDAWKAALEDSTTFEIKYRMVNAQTNVEKLVTCKARPLIKGGQLAGYIGILE